MPRMRSGVLEPRGGFLRRHQTKTRFAVGEPDKTQQPRHFGFFRPISKKSHLLSHRGFGTVFCATAGTQPNKQAKPEFFLFRPAGREKNRTRRTRQTHLNREKFCHHRGCRAKKKPKNGLEKGAKARLGTLRPDANAPFLVYLEEKEKQPVARTSPTSSPDITPTLIRHRQRVMPFACPTSKPRPGSPAGLEPSATATALVEMPKNEKFCSTDR